MTSFPEFLTYWQDRIRRDLTPFADPGTEVQLGLRGRTVDALWWSRAKEYTASFAISVESGVSVTFMGLASSYPSFLSGPEMGNLLGLAKMILQSQQQAVFVDTKAQRTDGEAENRTPAVPLLQEILASPNDSDLTRILIVTGEAGAGKTRVLQELVRRQAADFVSGRTRCLHLYINAQGRALARFNEALATELDDLRSTLTYHSISTLVRAGVLVPIIDGFDELIGVGGYDDAFSSLAGFIEELNGSGQLVASARSTYYQEEFVSRASTASALGSQAWLQVPVEVASWGNDEFREYVSLLSEERGLSGQQKSELTAKVERVFGSRHEELRKKPLFVARTVDLILTDPSFVGGDDLLKELVRGYLERERREKLLAKGGTPLLTQNHMMLLMTTLAEEMWNQETRELPTRAVREVAEYVLITEGIPETSQRVVVERMPTLAFMAAGERGTAFEHEMFFSYFLSNAFAETLLSGTSPRLMLSRSVLPNEVASRTVEMLYENGALRKDATLERLLEVIGSSCTTEGMRATQIKENAGLITAMLLKREGGQRGLMSGLSIKGVIFPGGDLCGVALERCALASVIFRRVDLSQTRFVACSADDVLFVEVTVSPDHTRLEFEGLDVMGSIQGLRLRSDTGVKLEYDPAAILQALARCGAVRLEEAAHLSTRSVKPADLNLLERLVRAYLYRNPICKSDDKLAHLFSDPRWQQIEKLLNKHELVTIEQRSTGGPKKSFLRRQFLPDQLMAGLAQNADVPPAVKRFWDELEAQAEKS